MSQTFTYKIWTSIVHFLGSYYSIHIHYPSVARQVVANQKDHNKKNVVVNQIGTMYTSLLNTISFTFSNGIIRLRTEIYSLRP